MNITDTDRINYLEAHPRDAEMVLEGVRTPCYFYGIAAAPDVSLRQAIDTVITKGGEDAGTTN